MKKHDETRSYTACQLDQIMRKTRKTGRFVAKQLNVSEVTVSQWRNGHDHPTPNNLAALAGVFGVPVEYFTVEDFDETGIIVERGDGAPAPGKIVASAATPEAVRIAALEAELAALRRENAALHETVKLAVAGERRAVAGKAVKKKGAA